MEKHMGWKYIGWTSLEEVKRSFFGDDEPDDFPTDDEIIVAWYDSELYDGSAFILFRRDGELFEVNAWHCSCCGVEGQWNPKMTSIVSLKMRRPAVFPFCIEYKGVYEKFVELLDSLTEE